jgi:hypothetical protein
VRVVIVGRNGVQALLWMGLEQRHSLRVVVEGRVIAPFPKQERMPDIVRGKNPHRLGTQPGYLEVSHRPSISEKPPLWAAFFGDTFAREGLVFFQGRLRLA